MQDSNRGRRNRALRLIAAEPLPALPSPEQLLPAVARRPGELHEPLLLGPAEDRALAEGAVSTGVARDVIASACLELALLLERLPDGVTGDLTLPPPPKCPGALGAAEADYRRSLTLGARPRRASAQADGGTVAVPARIAARLRAEVPEGAFTPERIRSALAWEIAAVSAGWTLSECVLMTLVEGC